MNTTVTVGGVLIGVAVVIGIVGFLAACIFILDLLNPFRSGH